MPMLVIKTSYLLTWHCILKIMQLMLGTICVGIIGNNFMDHHFPYSNGPQNFFLIVTTTFYINTLILFISYLFSSSAPVIRKTNYEFLCNATTCVLFLTASIAVLVQINKKNYYYNYKALLAASIFGLLNSMLYLCNAVFDYDIQMKNQENA